MSDGDSWARLGILLAERAAHYNHLTTEGLAEDAVVDIVRSDRLDNSQEADWWWVYAPLLSKVLRNGSVGLATLGQFHHPSAADLHRVWVSFVPTDLLPEEQESIAKLSNFLTQQLGDQRFTDYVLLTTDLLEMVASAAQVVRTADKSALRPIALQFDSGALPLLEVADGLWLDATGVAAWNPDAALTPGASTDQIRITVDPERSAKWKQQIAAAGLEPAPKLLERLERGASYLKAIAEIVKASSVVALPAWLPPQSGSVQTGTLVLYVRKSLAPDDLLGIFSAYLTGGLRYLGKSEGIRIRELELMNQRLAQLRVPFDHLASSFDLVLTQAREMRTLLYAPEESIFRSHRLIADYFSDSLLQPCRGYVIDVKHDITNVADGDVPPLLTVLLCAIFGKQEELREARNLEDLLIRGKFYLSLTESDVRFQEEVTILKEVLAIKSLEGVVEQVKSDYRIGREALGLLKVLLFTPFKDLGNSRWDLLPFQVAVMGANYKRRAGTSSRPLAVGQTSPFPQHGVIDFILAAKSYYKNRSEKAGGSFRSIDSCESCSMCNCLTIQYRGDGSFFDPPSRDSGFQRLLEHFVEHGVAGASYGNFYSCFAKLFRSAYGRLGDRKWELVDAGKDGGHLLHLRRALNGGAADIANFAICDSGVQRNDGADSSSAAIPTGALSLAWWTGKHEILGSEAQLRCVRPRRFGRECFY